MTVCQPGESTIAALDVLSHVHTRPLSRIRDGRILAVLDWAEVSGFLSQGQGCCKQKGGSCSVLFRGLGSNREHTVSCQRGRRNFKKSSMFCFGAADSEPQAVGRDD